jgi:hypothetical protein
VYSTHLNEEKKSQKIACCDIGAVPVSFTTDEMYGSCPSQHNIQLFVAGIHVSVYSYISHHVVRSISSDDSCHSKVNILFLNAVLINKVTVIY